MSLMCTFIIKILFANLIKNNGSEKNYSPELIRRQHFGITIIIDQNIILIIEQSEHILSLKGWFCVVLR